MKCIKTKIIVNIEIICKKGIAYLQGEYGKICFMDATIREEGQKNQVLAYIVIQENVFPGAGHLEQIKKFYQSIVTKQSPKINMSDALDTANLTLAIYKAAEIDRNVFCSR